jgi:hypothetical protein
MTYNTGILAFGQSVNGKKNLPLVQKSCALTSPCLKYWMGYFPCEAALWRHRYGCRRYGSGVA